MIQRLPPPLLTSLLLALAFAFPLISFAQFEVIEPDTVNKAKPSIASKQELTPQLLYQMLLAEFAINRGQIPLSAGLYGDLAKTLRDPQVAKRATEIALYARQPEAALAAARIWVELEPESQSAHSTMVGLLLGAKRLEEIQAHIAKLLALAGPDIGNSLLRLNRQLSSHSDKQALQRLVEQVTIPYEGLAEAHFARAQAAVGARDEARASAELERALTLRQDWELAVLFKAQLEQRNSPPQALETLRRFIVDNPKSREVRLAYARGLVGEKHYEDARREFNALLEAYPDDPDMIYAVALLSLQLNDYRLAETHLKRLTKDDFRDANAARLYLGQIAEETERPEEALRWYAEVSLGGQFHQAQSRASALLLKQGKLDEARKLLQQAATLHPDASPSDRVSLLIAEAQLLRNAGRVEDAYALLEKNLAAQPEQLELLYEAALLAEKVRKFEVMERNLRKLILLKPDHAHAYNALGYSFADRNERLDEAQQLIDKALQLAPDDPFIIDSKGWLLYRRGDKAGASDVLKKALGLRQDPEIAAHLGEVQWISGQRNEALKTWSEALKANPGNEVLSDTIKKFKP